MKKKLEVLINLQKVEAEKDAILRALSGIPEKTDALDAEIAECEKKLADETVILEELRKKYRGHEIEVKENHSKIRKSKERSNAVKTNKEYQAMLKEIEDMETKNSEIEDIMLEYLGQTEEKEKYIAGIKKESARIRERTDKEKEKLHKEKLEGGKKLSRLESEAEALLGKADPDLLKKYLKVRQRVPGHAIVSVIGGTCSGCNMNIPAQMYNELHRFDSLRYCPFCYRMVYLDFEKA